MKYLIIITLLLANLLTKAQFNDTLDKALLNAEFNLWQANSDSSRFLASLEKIQLYRHSALYQQALNEADRTDNYSLTGTEKAQLKYERMLNSFLANRYSYCSTLIFDSAENAEHSKQIEFMTLYSLNESGDWGRCKTEILQYLSITDSDKKKEIILLPVSYKYKSPEKSRHLSAFLPGLGEIYSGYPLKGITSFILNAGFLTFAGYNFYFNYYVTGCVSGIFPFLKFYKGGKRLSTNLADRHNEQESNKIKRQYSAEILDLAK